jgi:DNA repair protein RecN (Recombination protein N)
MLLELRIFNLALIERAEIVCGPGFNILTGETGAGKSILIHALGLLVGERATADQVGKMGAEDGTTRARVEGAFDLSHAPRALEYLKEQDFPVDDNQLLVMREVTSDGRSRVRINGQMATATTLRELGNLLVDLHGQHEHQLLLRADTHMQFLDEFGGAAHARLQEATRNAYAEWRAAQRRFDDLTANEQQRAQRLDMLQFQAQEIDAVAPEAGEDAQLVDERARLMNSEKLRAAAALCRDALLGADEAGASTLLSQALRAAREIESVDGSVSTWVEELQSAIYEIEDAAAEARRYADSLDADPLRLEEIETRLHRLTRLKRKYGDSIEQVLAYRAEVEDELARLNVSEEELAGLRAATEAQRQKFLQAAQKLSQARRALAQRFEAQVVSHLQTLAMERARLEVGFQTDEAGSAEGIDRVEFLFSANPGQPLRPLARIASGGEISRVMLALRSALFAPTGDDPAAGVIPVLVFDEVDTGIGGVTAEAVGEKMRELARGFQVFCVTHLPQIARRADSHYRVLKESDEAQTRVSVTRLEGEERVRELARMMGRESETTLQHARELLNSANANTSSRNGTGDNGASPNGVQAKGAASKSEKPRARRAK